MTVVELPFLRTHAESLSSPATDRTPRQCNEADSSRVLLMIPAGIHCLLFVFLFHAAGSGGSIGVYAQNTVCTAEVAWPRACHPGSVAVLISPAGLRVGTSQHLSSEHTPDKHQARTDRNRLMNKRCLSFMTGVGPGCFRAATSNVPVPHGADDMTSDTIGIIGKILME
jgi:hypothetical protein